MSGHRIAITATVLLCAATAGAADVHVGIDIGPPPIVVEAPPRLVVVPGVPTVQYAPDLGYDYFVYGGRYYTMHDDAWFVSPSYGGPWAYVPRARVPRPVLVVPARYYTGGPHPHHVRYEERHGHHHEHGQHHGDHHGDDDHHHGHHGHH